MFEIEVTLERVDAETRQQPEWDRLARPYSFFSSWQWLHYADETTPQTLLLACARRAGELVAAVPVWIDEPPAGGMFTAEKLRFDPSHRKVMFLGPPKAYECEVLAVDGPAGDLAASELLRALDGLAGELGCSAVVGAYATPETVRRTEGAGVLARATEVTGSADIHLPDGVEGWLAGLPRKRRVAVQHEMSVFRDAGYGVRELPLIEACEVAAPLVTQLQNKHGDMSTVDEIERLLRLQAQMFGEDARVLLASVDDEVTAVCVLYFWQRTCVARMLGLDYGRLRNAFEYFNIVYYEPIRLLDRAGVDLYQVGLSALAAKTARGAVVRPLYSVEIARSRD